MWLAFANEKAIQFFSAKKISVYAIFNDQSFKDMLTNDIISFEQLGPGNELGSITQSVVPLTADYF